MEPFIGILILASAINQSWKDPASKIKTYTSRRIVWKVSIIRNSKSYKVIVFENIFLIS